MFGLMCYICFRLIFKTKYVVPEQSQFHYSQIFFWFCEPNTDTIIELNGIVLK